jgi:hypothetical protein
MTNNFKTQIYHNHLKDLNLILIFQWASNVNNKGMFLQILTNPTN